MNLGIASIVKRPSPATKAGAKLTLKRVAGLPARSLARRAWGWSAEEHVAVQTEALQQIYHYARLHVPYYRSLPEDYPALGPIARVQEFLDQLPVLAKQTVKAQNEAFWPSPLLPMTSFHTTSGTSGTPLRIPATLWERAQSQAILDDWYQRIAGTRQPRALYLSGFMTPSANDREIYWTDRITGSIFLSIYSLNERNRGAIRDLFNRFRPQLIYGYASAVHQLALLFAGEPVMHRQETVSVVTSEVLEPHWRETIEATIVRRVFDLYSSQEGNHVAIECEHGHMHIHPLAGVIEIVDRDGKPTPAGEAGRVLVTGLRRKSMPLIRYEIGDVAMSTGFASDCSCGLQWPTIGSVQGRSEDLVITRDGRRIGYLCFHATKNLRGIKEAQLTQTGFDQFRFSIVPSETEPFVQETVEGAIRAELHKRLQGPTEIAFHYLDAIPRGPNGKFKAVVVAFTPVGLAA